MTGVSGLWRIESVKVDAETVVDEGFDQLLVSDNQISIEPAGIEFSVNQSTWRSAVLESRSEVYFAEFSKRDDKLTFEITRPAFNETIRLYASMA
ncbi:MAG: hypothetical protein GY818_04425 [Planctomycetaceae bacterium]|nr:hypothetical protein [Planctomycetaceae bacterium]